MKNGSETNRFFQIVFSGGGAARCLVRVLGNEYEHEIDKSADIENQMKPLFYVKCQIKCWRGGGHRGSGGDRTTVSNTRAPAKYKFMFILFRACTRVVRGW